MSPIFHRNLNLNDGMRGLHLLIISPVFLTIAILAVSLRFIARRMRRLDLAADDLWIMIALVWFPMENAPLLPTDYLVKVFTCGLSATDIIGKSDGQVQGMHLIGIGVVSTGLGRHFSKLNEDQQSSTLKVSLPKTC